MGAGGRRAVPMALLAGKARSSKAVLNQSCSNDMHIPLITQWSSWYSPESLCKVEVEGGVKRDNFAIFPCAPLDFPMVAFPDLSRCGWRVSAAVGQGVGKWRGRGRTKRGETNL